MLIREQLLETARQLSQLGLNRGTSGNVSVRDGEGFMITPSGMEVERMTPHDMVHLSRDGQPLSKGKPSSEWRFHMDIYRERPEIQAVVHTHAMFSTTLACLHRDIPPFHYMIAVAGGDTIRCAPYALFGSQALSDAAIQALKNRRACLLANHGMIAIGNSLQQALDVTVEVETLCEQYWRALQVGEPYILTSDEMADVMAQFKSYSKWSESLA